MQNGPQTLKTRPVTETAVPQGLHPRDLLSCGQSQARPQALQATLEPLRQSAVPSSPGAHTGRSLTLGIPSLSKVQKKFCHGFVLPDMIFRGIVIVIQMAKIVPASCFGRNLLRSAASLQSCILIPSPLRGLEVQEQSTKKC